ncbi:MAG TPA: 50S ribosomal protein L25 [Kiritimatiellia bacterium]|nr:50S ribosomal protein L25 [Kiritimatiellia bacterium]
MATAIKMTASKRAAQGSGPSRRLRKTGVVPGIVYGGGKDPVMVEINEHDFKQMLRKHTSESLLMDLEIDGSENKVILKEIQHHPVTGRIQHADFRVVSMTEKLEVSVPVVLVGEPVGVSLQGGVLESLMRSLTIRCLPADIPEKVEIDVSGLELGHHVAVKDIKLDPAKFTMVTPADYAVAAVSAPRVQVEETPAEEAAAEGEAAGAEGAAAAPGAEGAAPEKKEEKKEKKKE